MTGNTNRRRIDTRRGVMQAILQERDDQDDQWGELPRGIPAMTWLAVLMEEVGEVATEMIAYPEPDYDKLSEELVQVAAVAIAWLEEMGLTDG